MAVFKCSACGHEKEGRCKPRKCPECEAKTLLRWNHLRRISRELNGYEKGFIRKTKQRDLILKTLRNTDTHPTADWIYEQVKKEMPNISLDCI